jgi:FkbM family methyltransferase
MADLLEQTRSWRITGRAALNHATFEALAFVQSGGELSATSAAILGQSIPLSKTTWTALPHLSRFAVAGGRVLPTDVGMFELSLANGLRFQSTITHLADVLGALVERFVEEEYADLNVGNAVVIDVGAHIGDSAVYFLHRGAAFVHCYEPYPQMIESARANLRLNGLEPKVSLHQVGLAARSGEVMARFDPRRRATNLVTASRHGSRGDYQLVRLDRFTDAVLAVRGAHPQARLVCKMDCEGCEREIFAAAESSEALVQCDEWVIEFHPRVPEHVVQTLRGLGFATRQMLTEWGAEMLFAVRSTVAR